jgi:hypothetical protein
MAEEWVPLDRTESEPDRDREDAAPLIPRDPGIGRFPAGNAALERTEDEVLTELHQRPQRLDH